MAMSLPSSWPSSSISRWPRDVFLSFRGMDTRNTFVFYLYDALCRRGINTYIDEKDLERGESISPTLFKVIEESEISIIILSPNYASSTWCLEELTKILECKKTKEQIVLPIFYHVDPSEVQNCRGSFGEALAKHLERFKEDLKVKRWKASLQEVANLAGEHLEDGNESEFIHKIIQWVDSKIVRSNYKLNIAEYPIGIEPRVQDLNALLRIGRNDITLMIGIYGIGGIGKTTIAKAVYNSIAHQFEARCFLANIRDISSEDGIVKMQERLLYELLGNSISFSAGSARGIDVIERRLCSKKIFLILDNVTELPQLKKLAGHHNWFGPGSRIIITTRDKHLLTCHEVDSMYEVLGLDYNQAIQLFSWHAFKKDKPLESYVQLTNCIIGYVNGLPLALVVLGSYLHGRSVQEWKSALEKYERNPHKDIYEVLKLSYDGLDDEEKDIFLDIACFFNGNNVKYVKEILDGCGFQSTIGIKRLQENCLINIDESTQHLEMHDLLQQTGKEIVRQESPKEAGKRSRLWFHEDVRHVLEENTETDKIEGILLDFPTGDDMICLHPKAFGEMKNLRLFINHNAQFSGKLNYLSNELRVLDWPKYPSSLLPSSFHGNKLIIFKMPSSLIKDLRSLKSMNLTNMDFSSCKFLRKIPDLSRTPNLQQLSLQDCDNLVEVHQSVGFLDKLSLFHVNGCHKLKIFPKIFKLRSLNWLRLDNCSSLQDFPEIKCELVFLNNLSFYNTSIKEVPSSIENLVVLYQLDLSNTCIKELPSSIGNLTNLENLVLDHTRIKELPSSIGNLTNLETLLLGHTSIEELPSSIGKLTKLEYLSARGCKNLIHLPSSIDKLQSLYHFILDSCSLPINIGNVEEDGRQSTPNSSIFNGGSSLSLRFCCLSESNFFTNANYFPTLVELDLTGSDIVIFPPSVGFAWLRHLRLNNCKQLKEILPDLPFSIVKVEARGCTLLGSFAAVSKVFYNGNVRELTCPREIDLYGCHKLLVDMRIPSWEERDFKEENTGKYVEESVGIIYPGKRIPSWISFHKEAHDSNPCEIDINTHFEGDIEEIVFCVVFGFKVGINLEMKKTTCVRIHDGCIGWPWNVLCSQCMTFKRTDSDHVFMARCLLPYHDEAHTSRFIFECDSELVVFRSVGVHLVKKHEDNARDHHTGAIHEDVGAHFDSSSEEIERHWVDSMDGYHYTEVDEYEFNLNHGHQQKDENPEEDMELENDDENPNERCLDVLFHCNTFPIEKLKLPFRPSSSSLSSCFQ